MDILIDKNLIIEKYYDMGASLAGIAAVSSLRNDPFYEVYDKFPYYDRCEKFLWPENAQSVLYLHWNIILMSRN